VSADFTATRANYSSAALKNNKPKNNKSIYMQALSCATVLVDIDLVASHHSGMVLLSQRSSRGALLEARHPERLVHVSRQRRLVEGELTAAIGSGRNTNTAEMRRQR